MLLLPEKTREDIIFEIAKSSIPTNIGLTIINILNDLAKVDDSAKENIPVTPPRSVGVTPEKKPAKS